MIFCLSSLYLSCASTVQVNDLTIDTVRQEFADLEACGKLLVLQICPARSVKGTVLRDLISWFSLSDTFGVVFYVIERDFLDFLFNLTAESDPSLLDL
jgi:hypothetical protein